MPASFPRKARRDVTDPVTVLAAVMVTTAIVFPIGVRAGRKDPDNLPPLWSEPEIPHVVTRDGLYDWMYEE